VAAGDVRELQKIAQLGREISGLAFGVYLGDLPLGRESALAHHAEMRGAERAILVAVDPERRVVEIVVGVDAMPLLDQRACELAVLAMVSAFPAGQIVPGIRDGVTLLADHARTPHVEHLDNPA
jgi:hypothetical protein